MFSDLIYTVLLGPVLLVQGVYVKRRTPELPEPEGQRSGVVGDGPSLRVLIVGDSAAAGVGVKDQLEALSGQLQMVLSKQYCLHWQLIAKTGLNTKELIDELRSVDANEFDIAVTSLGVNDVTSGTSTQKFKQSQKDLYKVLVDRFSTQTIILTSVPPMHEFPALPQPLRWFLGRRAKALNSVLTELVESDAKLEFLGLRFPVDDEFFASDGFHPSKRAYKLWGNELADVIRRVDC